MRREIRRYTDKNTGWEIEEVCEPADFGRGYIYYKYVIRDGAKFIELMEYRETGMGIVDEKSGEEFELTPAQHLWNKEIAEQRQKLYQAETARLNAISEPRIQLEEKITRLDSVPGVNTWQAPAGIMNHTTYGGGGGGSSYSTVSEVIPYREAGFNTTTQRVLSNHAVHMGSLGPDYIAFHNVLMYVPVGCIKCDNVMKQALITETIQKEYDNWYEHYVDYQTQITDETTEQSTIAHLKFIMDHMMKCVYVGMESKMWIENNPQWPIPIMKALPPAPAEIVRKGKLNKGKIVLDLFVIPFGIAAAFWSIGFIVIGMLWAVLPYDMSASSDSLWSSIPALFGYILTATFAAKECSRTWRKK